MDNIVENIKEKVPEMVKENKGALIGAVIGYLLTNNEKAQSTILGLVAGSLLVDKKNKDEE